jgi:hypothetical protein
MAFWELRKRCNAFSAAPPMPASVLTICADWRRSWVGRERKAVPGETGPGSYFEGTAWFQTMTKYEIFIYWSEEDEAFVAEVPELPGCAAHGPTQDRALRNAQDAIGLWI